MNKYLVSGVVGGSVLVLALMGYVFGFFGTSDPYVKAPTNLTVKPGRALIINVETNGSEVKWFSFDDVDLIKQSNTSVMFLAPVKGTYKILIYTAKNNKASDPTVCVVEVTDNPGPGPGPGPTDPFVVALTNAFNLETTPDKAITLLKLQELYKMAADVTVKDPEIKNLGQLLAVLKDAANDLVGSALFNVRDAIRKELDTKLPTKADLVLDDALRKTFKDQFIRVADALGKVK